MYDSYARGYQRTDDMFVSMDSTGLGHFVQIDMTGKIMRVNRDCARGWRGKAPVTMVEGLEEGSFGAHGGADLAEVEPGLTGVR